MKPINDNYEQSELAKLIAAQSQILSNIADQLLGLAKINFNIVKNVTEENNET